MATTTKIGKKDLQQDEFLENMFDLGEWLEAHWKRVAAVAGGVLALVLLGIAWNGLRERTADEANALLGRGMDAYDPAPGADGKAPAPRYADALPLFEQAAAKAGSSVVGDVARFYRGRTLMALGRAPEAISVLEGVSASSNAALATQAKVALAQALAAGGNTDRAATILNEIAAAPAGIYPPAAAALALADLRAAQGKKAEAKKGYEDVVSRFPESPFAGQARSRISEMGAGTP
jgi:TolA-binding protein